MSILSVSEHTIAVELRYRGPSTGTVLEYRNIMTSVVVCTTSTASERYLKRFCLVWALVLMVMMILEASMMSEVKAVDEYED